MYPYTTLLEKDCTKEKGCCTVVEEGQIWIIRSLENKFECLYCSSINMVTSFVETVPTLGGWAWNGVVRISNHNLDVALSFWYHCLRSCHILIGGQASEVAIEKKKGFF